ncbi:hypothetical protein LV780_04855 [Cereibacter azotoformans]|uniref:hypothetical protein n=1 Tax=Cereibacter azotoformans TaxID=43057 RepID=UPI000E35EE23|nr:hypothetical protein [Cereibacter azotoformans]AXQ93199.1 hypothetical protein D0Z66_04845 [Cereibacter sphaeroides]UIJ31510.1 hypothetical protein LV780_04855 [Cereibacter azotoformans]
MTTEIRSIGDKISVRRAIANTAATAGGTGDATAVTGAIIDRAALGWPKSAVLAVPYTATLAAGKTLSLAYALQHGDASDLADASALASADAAVVATGPTGGGTLAGTFEVNVSLAGAKRYVRLNVTPDLSATATDTAALSGVIAFGGAESLPQ